ncbi:MAG: cell envelope integrity protein TolA [Pseudomonadales bacterium]|nr:cell envelope integrity protein TolA [Pseudomonadales bacterium]
MLKQFIAPLLLAVGFHGLIIGLFLIEWPQEEVLRVADAPVYISAALVTQDVPEQKVRQQKNSKPAKSKPVVIPPMLKPKPKADQKKKVVKPVAPIVTEPPPPPAPIESVKREPLAQDQAMAALMAAVTEEIGRQAVTNDEQILAYIGQVQRDIVSRWSRPPSARNGMEAVLRVRLVPTGEVVDVGVEQSSGNEAFDRSALLAVERSARFQVPSDPKLFENNFRSFTVLFRPEDLLL